MTTQRLNSESALPPTPTPVQTVKVNQNGPIRQKPLRPPNPDKFTTSPAQHARRKKKYYQQHTTPQTQAPWRWNRQAIADPEWLRDTWYPSQGTYMYHGTTPEAAHTIATEGLFPHDALGTGEEQLACPNCSHTMPMPISAHAPGQVHEGDTCPNCGDDYMSLAPSYSNSSYAGKFFEPRQGHVYLGTQRYSSSYGTKNGAMLRVDLSKLNPHLMNADEDHWFDAYRDHSHPAIQKVYEERPPPTQASFMNGSEHLGAWADGVSLGSEPEETHYSMGQGSMAYNGHIPPEAIEEVDPRTSKPFEPASVDEQIAALPQGFHDAIQNSWLTGGPSPMTTTVQSAQKMSDLGTTRVARASAKMPTLVPSTVIPCSQTGKSRSGERSPFPVVLPESRRIPFGDSAVSDAQNPSEVFPRRQAKTSRILRGSVGSAIGDRVMLENGPGVVVNIIPAGGQLDPWRSQEIAREDTMVVRPLNSTQHVYMPMSKMGTNLGWEPGDYGKGLITPLGGPVLWPTGENYGPHHYDMMEKMNYMDRDPRGAFYVNPDGTFETVPIETWKGGQPFRYPAEELANAFVTTHPGLRQAPPPEPEPAFQPQSPSPQSPQPQQRAWDDYMDNYVENDHDDYASRDRYSAMRIGHYNRWTGEVCHCPWNHHTVKMRKAAGQNINKILKAPDKAYRTPEGQAFRDALPNVLPEEYESLAPYIAQRWKRGEIRLGANHPTKQEPALYTQADPHQMYDEDPMWNEETNMPKGYGVWEPLTPISTYSPGQINRWHQWYEARQHPTRRGVNVMDPNFSVHEMNNKVNEHQKVLREERERQEVAQHGKTEYRVPEGKYKGWHVKHLTAGENDAGEDDDIDQALVHEGNAMSHCIGNDDQPYRQCAQNGTIKAYSLRDNKGWPHATWHYNSDGSLAEMFGHADSSLTPEYQQIVDDWGRQQGQETENEVGHQEGGGYDEYYQLSDPDDVQSYLGQYGQSGGGYDEAYEDYDANIGEDTEFLYGDPRWSNIAADYLSRGHRLTEFQRKDLHQTLNDTGHYGHMAEALKEEFDPEDKDHRGNAENWNATVPDGRHEIEIPENAPDDVSSYNELHEYEGNVGNPDWDNIAQDYLNDPEVYPYRKYNPGGKPSLINDFHQYLHENDHAEDMWEALNSNADWSDPDHQNAIQRWNYGMPEHNLYQEPESTMQWTSPQQEEFQWSPARATWEDPTLPLTDRLQQYTDHPEFRQPWGGGTFSSLSTVIST